MPAEIYKPAPIEKRTALERFQQMNRWVNARGGLVVSPPGEAKMRIECLPGSALPGDLEAAGYELSEDGTRERLLELAIREQFTRNADGSLSPLVEGSTKAVAEVRRHAGVARVEVFTFRFAAEEPP